MHHQCASQRMVAQKSHPPYGYTQTYKVDLYFQHGFTYFLPKHIE